MAAEVTQLGIAARADTANMLEVFEIVKNLDIDVAQEPEMLWIAEEAYNAQLPPGWEEQADEKGRAYFYNATTKESCWQSPSHGLFQDVVEYWRRIHTTGGFWKIEDELRDLEQKTQQDANEWVERPGENGESIYYNNRTEQRRVDDPRLCLFHELHARTCMMAKMKEHAPVLARVPRPEDETIKQEREKILQEKEQQRSFASVLNVQCAARCFLAKRKVRRLRARDLVDKGSQPLKQRLQLRRVEGTAPGVQREVRLTENPEHRRFKAAQRIQSHVRGIQCRREVCPVLAHHKFLHKQARVIQKRARPFIVAKREKREKEERLYNAACSIQSFVRGRKVRKFLPGMRAERARFDFLTKNAIKAQSVWRVGLSRSKVQRQHSIHKDNKVSIIQRKMKVWLAQRQLNTCRAEYEPFQLKMVKDCNPQNLPTTTLAHKPWRWQLLMQPIDTRGRMTDYPYQAVDLFSDNAIFRERRASIKIQASLRGKLAKLRLKRRVKLTNWLADELVNGSLKLVAARRNAVLRVQSFVRGQAERKRDVLGQRRHVRMLKVEPEIQQAQAYLRCYLAQKWLVHFSGEGSKETSAIVIQACWRGWLARAHIKCKREEALWPMKSWFEYKGMGADSVRMEVQFFANMRFDEFRHFSAYGSHEDKNARSKGAHVGKKAQAGKNAGKKGRKIKTEHHGREEEEEVEEEDEEEGEEHTETSQNERHQKKEKKKKGRTEAQRENARGGAAEVSQGVAQAVAQAGAAEVRADGQLGASLNLEVQGETGEAGAEALRLPDEIAADTAAAALKAKAKAKARANQGYNSAIPDTPLSPHEWSPRRGHLSPGLEAREGADKERALSREHFCAQSKEPTSPMASILSPKSRSKPSRPASRADADVTSPVSRQLQEIGNPFFMDESQECGPASEMTGAKVTAVLAQQEPEKQDVQAREDVSDDATLCDTAYYETAYLDNTDIARRTQGKEDPTHLAPQRSAPQKIKPKTQPSGHALSLLQCVAKENGIGLASSRPSRAPRQLRAGSVEEKQPAPPNVQDIGSRTDAEQLAIITERRRKVEELVRREKKHTDRLRKHQIREAKKLGEAAGDFAEDEDRRRKVLELKAWLKQKELALTRTEPDPRDRISKAMMEEHSLVKLEQDHIEMRERRARIGDQKREAFAMNAASPQIGQPLVHRHVHHHVHQRIQTAPGDVNRLGMMQSASAGDFRSGTADGGVPMGMQYRPLVHSASAGSQALPGIRAGR